ncbi:MAG: hypothetical protein U0X73_06935 [Thermoanaerobaculia bacterium]
MARTNYSFEKRQKEAARKKKQEEKRKRRQERGAGDAPIGEEGAPQGEAPNAAPDSEPATGA